MKSPPQEYFRILCDMLRSQGARRSYPSLKDAVVKHVTVVLARSAPSNDRMMIVLSLALIEFTYSMQVFDCLRTCSSLELSTNAYYCDLTYCVIPTESHYSLTIQCVYMMSMSLQCSMSRAEQKRRTVSGQRAKSCSGKEARGGTDGRAWAVADQSGPCILHIPGFHLSRPHTAIDKTASQSEDL